MAQNAVFQEKTSILANESAISCARVAYRCDYIKLRAHTTPLWFDVEIE